MHLPSIVNYREVFKSDMNIYFTNYLIIDRSIYDDTPISVIKVLQFIIYVTSESFNYKFNVLHIHYTSQIKHRVNSFTISKRYSSRSTKNVHRRGRSTGG